MTASLPKRNKPTRLDRALQMAGATSIGDIELLAGFDTGSKATRLALWLPEYYKHPQVPKSIRYGSDRAHRHVEVMAYCKRRIQKRISAGLLSLTSASRDQ